MLVSHHPRGHRIPASRVVTIAHTSLFIEAGWANHTSDFRKLPNDLFLRAGLDRGRRMRRDLPVGQTGMADRRDRSFAMTPRAIAIGLAVAAGLATSGRAADELAGLPKDAAAVVIRIEVCSHFANEEAYDKARARQIARVIRQYRCDIIDRDEAKMRKRYADDPNVIKALDGAPDD
jgi:hypothetical protein